MKKKLAVFLPSLRGGGAQRVAVDIANGLAARNHSVDLLLASSDGVYKDLLDPAVKIIDFELDCVRKSIGPLISYLKSSNPDSLLSIQRNAVLTSLLAKWLSKWNGKFVARETNSFQINQYRKQTIKDKYLSFVVRKLYRYSDVVVAPSAGVAAELCNCCDVHIIPNPVNIPNNVKPFKHDKPFILGVGSLDNQKRFADLINAFNLLDFNNEEECDLIILGEGPERIKLEQLCEKFKITSRVHMPGFVDNPFSYMKAASVFVLTSAWEGLPNAMLQAIACGTPVVATDCPHGPSEILAQGKYGPLVPVGDVNAICQAIKCQLKSDTKILYDDNVLKTYRYEKIIDAYEQLLVH